MTTQIIIDRAVVEQALEACEQYTAKELTVGQRYTNEGQQLLDAITALRAALAEQPVEREPEGSVCGRCGGLVFDPILPQPAKPAEQKPVTVLLDGSAFAVMSFPLPEDHWLYAERQYNDGEYEPVELGKPILTHALRDAVVSAVRYAIRGATNCGKEADFDPDALVQNAVYALCGPFTQAYTAPPPAKPAERVPLTDEEIKYATLEAANHLIDHIYEYGVNSEGVSHRIYKFARAIEAKILEQFK